MVLAALLVLLAAMLWPVGAPLSAQLHDLRQQLRHAWQAVHGWLQGMPFGQRLLELADDLRASELPWSNIASVASRTLHGAA